MPTANLKLSSLQLDLPVWEAEGAWTGAENVRFPRGFGQRVKGDEIFVSEVSGYLSIRYALNVFDVDGNYWLAGHTNKITVTDGSTWKTITPLGYTTTTNSDPFTGGVLNGVPFINTVDNATGHYWGKDFTTPTVMAALPNSPNVKAMRPYRNFMIGMDSNDDGGGGTNWPDTEESVIWSAAAEPNTIPATWIPATDNLAGAFQLGSTTGPVIDGIQLRNDFIIGKSDGIHIMTFIGGTDVMAQRQIYAKSGILSRNCLAEFEGIVYLLANNDILATDGTNIRSIANNQVKDYIFSQLATDASRSFVAANPTGREIWFCPMLTSATNFPDQIFVYDVDTQAWGTRRVYKTDDGTTSELAYAVDGVDSTTETDTWDGGDSSSWDAVPGPIWNKALSSPQTKAMIWVHPLSDGGLDGCLMRAGTNTDSRASLLQRDGIRFTESNEVVTLRRLWLDAEIPSGGSIDVTVGARFDDTTGYTYGAKQTYSATDRYLSVMAKGREFSIKFEHTGAQEWSLTRMGLEAAEMGGRF